MIFRPRRLHGAFLRSALPVLALSALLTSPLRGQDPTGGVDPVVRPGDVIRLQVWREPEWSGDFLVDQFGVVTLPWMGDVAAAGETQRSLKSRVQAALAKEVHNPALQLLVLKRVRVLGEVRTPGVFVLDPTQTVADALALAGGRTNLAVEGPVVLRRAGETVTADIVQDTRLSDLAVQTGDELLVRQKSWLGRNAGPLVGAGVGFLGVLIAVLVR